MPRALLLLAFFSHCCAVFFSALSKNHPQWTSGFTETFERARALRAQHEPTFLPFRLRQFFEKKEQKKTKK